MCYSQSPRFGLWTPNAVMKMLTTTIRKTRPVAKFSIKFSLQCFCSSFRFHRTVDKARKYNLTTHKHTLTEHRLKQAHYTQLSFQPHINIYLVQDARTLHVHEWSHKNTENQVFNPEKCKKTNKKNYVFELYINSNSWLRITSVKNVFILLNFTNDLIFFITS